MREIHFCLGNILRFMSDINDTIEQIKRLLKNYQRVFWRYSRASK